MKKDERISFKCTLDEYNQILNSKNTSSYRTLSDYCREISKEGKIKNYHFDTRKEILDKIDEMTDCFKSLKKDIVNLDNKELNEQLLVLQRNQNLLIDLLYFRGGSWKGEE